MQFKLDENLPAELAALFNDAGHDAVTVLDQQLGGTPDSDLLLICAREHRTIVIFDTGFTDIRAYPPRSYCPMQASADNSGSWKSQGFGYGSKHF